MAETLSLVWNLIANDGASGTFRKVGAEAEGASGAVGKLMGGFAALAGGAAIAASVKAAATFQASMLLVQTQAGASRAEVEKMTPAILALSGQVAQAPEALANSLYHVESTGLRGKQALDAVRIAAEGAKVGHADLEQTTNALTATIASGMLPATETYGQAMGQLNTIVGSGDMKMSDLNDALSTGLLVTTKQYGVTLNDVGAALADFGDNNIRGSDAATKLRMAVQALESPAKGGAAALEKIGITQKELAQDMSTGGLNKALTDLHTHLENSGVDANQWGQILTDAFGKKAGSGVITLIGTFDRFKAKYDEVSKGAVSFGDAWSSTTKTASFQFSALRDSVDAVGIKIGTALLPYITDLAKHVTDFVKSTGFQDFLTTAGHDAVAAGDAIRGLVHWFSELPEPIKVAAETMAALKIAETIGLFGKLVPGLTFARAAMAEFSSATSAGAGALAVAKSAGSSLMSLMGGPWVMSIGLITAAVVASQHEIDTWTKGLEQGGREAAIATSQMNDAHTRSIVDATSLGDAWGIVKGAFADGLSQIKGYSSALDESQHKEKDWYDHLSASEKITQNVTVATNNLKEALAQHGSKSDEVKWAVFEYNQALGDQKGAEERLDAATRGANGALQSRISLEQQLSQSSVSLDQATLSSKQAIDDYKKSLKDSNVTEDARKQALDNVSQSIFGVMDAAKQKADAETKGLPKQVITNQEIVRQRDALNQVVGQLGFVPPALQGMYDSLNGPTAKALEASKTNVNNLGSAMTTVANDDINGTFLPALDKLAKAAGSTVPQAVTGAFLPAAKGAGDAITQTGGLADANGNKISMYGQIIAGLPDSHNTTITADTSQAQATIDAFLANVKAKGFVGAVFNVGSPVGSGAQGGGLIGVPPVRKAAGGPISGPGSGTSDSVLIAASNGEHMWTAAETQAAGGHAGVEALRKAVLAHGGGRAAGGPIYPVDWSKSVQDGWAASLSKATAFSGGGGGAGSPLIRALGQNIANAMGFGSQFPAVDFVFSHESGWNPNAQNPTSSAYGIPQFLSSTWAQYGGKTSDPSTQIRDGIGYMVDRYGSPNGAAAFWQGHHWYDNGGYLMPGLTMAYNGTGKPERIRTAEQESALHGGGGEVVVNIIDRDGSFVERMRGEIVRSGQAAQLSAAAGSSRAIR